MPAPLITLAPDLDTWSLAAIRASDDTAFALDLSVARGAESETLTLATSRDALRTFAFDILATVGDATLRTFEPGLLAKAAPAAEPVAPSSPDRDAVRAQGFTAAVCPPQ